jgi:hypothetical protein
VNGRSISLGDVPSLQTGDVTLLFNKEDVASRIIMGYCFTKCLRREDYAESILVLARSIL